MASTTRQTDDDARERRRAQQRALITASVEQLRSSDGWLAYLKARQSFYNYSVGNLLLIALQHPTATRVAGFRAWLKLGYCVRKGETGIRIWAPCPPSTRQLKAWRDAGANPQDKPRVYFKLAAVFDTLSRVFSVSEPLDESEGRVGVRDVKARSSRSRSP